MDEQHDSAPAFTTRSMVASLLGVLWIAGLAGFHDDRIFGSTLMVGNHLPVGAFTYLVAVGLVWNGLAGRFRRSLALTSPELTVVMIATLVACFAPTSGLFRYFHRGIIMPWHFLTTGDSPQWEQHGLLDRLLAPKLFPRPVPFRDAAGVWVLDETVYRGFFTGLASGHRRVPLSELPFRAWLGALSYWGPLVLLCAFATTALAFLVHRQWAQHEQLSYPIAQIASGFCQRQDRRPGVPDLFHKRLFWAGFLPLFLFYGVEYLSRWYPESIPSTVDIFPAMKSWWLPVTHNVPLLTRAPGHWALNWQAIYFCVVGLAYFVSSEISLTMGLSSVLLVTFGVWYYQIAGQMVTGDHLQLMRGGAYLGYALVLLYTGRGYYLRVLLHALGFRGRRGPSEGGPAAESVAGRQDDDVGVTAARMLLAATAGMILTLTAMGSNPWLATLYSLLILLLFLVLTRIVCETGIPFVAAGWMPGRMMVALLGPALMGPGTLMLLLWVSNALCIDPRECLMPYVATGARMAQEARLRLRRVFWFVLGVIVVAVAVAFVAQHWTLYNIGPMADVTAARNFPRWHFNTAARLMGEMGDMGTLEAGFEARGWARLRLFSPEPHAWSWVLAAMAAVLGFSALRFRFTAFPLHPVLLLVWGTYPAMMLWGSFLLGWFIKTLVVRFGGGAVYQRLKPLFIGLIASELLASGVIILVDLLYYAAHGTPPRVLYRVLPG